MDDKLKKLLQDEMQKEADIIMEAVNNDPMVRDAEAPDSVRDKLFQQIRDYEEQKTATQMSEENQELIRLGKVYKKKRKRRKYYVLVAVFILALGGGVITTMGGPKRVFQEVKWILAGRQQTNIDTEDERVQGQVAVTEEEAYQMIEDALACVPARMIYMPENMRFADAYVDKNIESAYVIYEHLSEDGKVITYSMYPNHRTSSIANDVEDECIKEYSEDASGVAVQVKEYKIKDYDKKRWCVTFEYQDIRYFMTATGLTEDELRNLIKNLKFF